MAWTALDQLTKKVLKRYPRLALFLGRIGVASLALGAITTFILNYFKIREAILQKFGPFVLEMVNYAVIALTILLFAVGYLALGIWVYRRHVKGMTAARRHTYAASVSLVGLALTVGSIYFAYRPTSEDIVYLNLETRLMRESLLLQKSAEGGLRYSKTDPSVDPQVWSTAQSVVGILSDPEKPIGPARTPAFKENFEFFEGTRLQGNEGWGYQKATDWGATEIGAWVILAYLRSLDPGNVDVIWNGDTTVPVVRVQRDLEMLLGRQMSNGGWAPINDNKNLNFARTYSTVMAVWALSEARKQPALRNCCSGRIEPAVKGGISWLLTKYDQTHESWVPNPERSGQNDKFPGLTAQVLFVLGNAGPEFEAAYRENAVFERARKAFGSRLMKDHTSPDKGLMGRDASDNDRAHDSDRYLPRSRYMIEASTFLWLPWAITVCTTGLPEGKDSIEKANWEIGCRNMFARSRDLATFTRSDPFTYVTAEALFAFQRLRAKLKAAPVISAKL